MLRLTFLTGEFREILFGYGAAVIPPHSFLFSLVGFRGNGIGLQIADVVGNLPYSVAEIGVIGVSGIITANRHLGKPFVFGSFSIVRQTVVYGKVNLQFLYLRQIVNCGKSLARCPEARNVISLEIYSMHIATNPFAFRCH